MVTSPPSAKMGKLQDISPDEIRPNPANPRLFFHEGEMVQLMNSISEVGIQVPITAYEEGNHFIILDGERRWRCAKRLNLSVVPAIIQEKPSPLENLLMMFNIHNVREDWDLIAISKKIGEICEMLKAEGKKHDEKTIASLTGVTLTTVKRSFELLRLPSKYQRMLLKEASKPRSEQRIKPDLFLEIYKSMATVDRYIPEVFEKVAKSEFVDALVDKYSTSVIDNVIAFRDLSKIARAERAGVDKSQAIPTVVRLVKNKSYDIQTAYEETVQAAYEQRDLTSRAAALHEQLHRFKRRPSAELAEVLKDLASEIRGVLKR